MQVEEVRKLIVSVKAIERESERIRTEIETQRLRLCSIPSANGGGDRVQSCDKISMPEAIYFKLEQLYVQLSNILQALYDKRELLEKAIAELEPLEQEVARAWAAGKTAEQIGNVVGYSDRQVRRIKKRILIKMSKK